MKHGPGSQPATTRRPKKDAVFRIRDADGRVLNDAEVFYFVTLQVVFSCELVFVCWLFYHHKTILVGKRTNASFAAGCLIIYVWFQCIPAHAMDQPPCRSVLRAFGFWSTGMTQTVVVLILVLLRESIFWFNQWMSSPTSLTEWPVRSHNGLTWKIRGTRSKLPCSPAGFSALSKRSEKAYNSSHGWRFSRKRLSLSQAVSVLRVRSQKCYLF